MWTTVAGSQHRSKWVSEAATQHGSASSGEIALGRLELTNSRNCNFEPMKRMRVGITKNVHPQHVAHGPQAADFALSIWYRLGWIPDLLLASRAEISYEFVDAVACGAAPTCGLHTNARRWHSVRC